MPVDFNYEIGVGVKSNEILEKNKENIKKCLQRRKVCNIISLASGKIPDEIIENARLAQLVEHLTLNQGVQGSNP